MQDASKNINNWKSKTEPTVGTREDGAFQKLSDVDIVLHKN